MLFQHSLIYLLAKIIPAIVAFAALSIYTHYLTPSEYGIYTLIFTGALFLHNVIFNWLPAGTLRFWSNERFDRTSFTSTLAINYFKISTVLLFFTVAVVIFYWGETNALWAISAYLLLLALAIYTITQSILSAKIEPVYYAYLTISYALLALSAGTLFAYLGYGAIGVILGITIGLSTPAIFIYKKIWLPFNRKSNDKELLKNLLVYGLPFASAALLEELTKVADRFMLAWLQDKSQAGLYAVGYDLSGNSIMMIMSAINLAAYPVVIKLLDSKGKKVAMEYFYKYTVLLLAVSIPAVMGLNLVGPDLIYLLIDEKYHESVLFLLPWITSAVFIMGLQAFYFDLAFQLGHRVITIVKISAIVATINLILNYWLIPIMGIQGAAIATLLSFTIGSLLSALLGRTHFSLPFPLKEFLKIILSTLVMGACLWWLKDLRGWGWLILQLGVGIVSYSIMIISFNVMEARSYLIRFIRSE